jgi:hypothetical protein
MRLDLGDTALRRLAAVICAFCLSAAALGFYFKQSVTRDDIFGIPFFAFATVGALVAYRRPRNRIGWILTVVGLAPTLAFFSSAYAYRGTLTEGGMPADWLLEWISSWLWFPGIAALITFGLLLFPDGHLPSKRWRVVPYLAGSMIAIVAITLALQPGPMEPFDPALPSNVNPFGWESGRAFIEAAGGIAFMSFPAFALACASSLLFRFRRADSQTRQQIKWFAYSSLMLVFIIMFEDLLDRLLGDRLAELFFLVGMIFPSVGAGIGILKYRLYDIDVVINRTAVYGSLTAILAVTYLGIVVLLQQVLKGVTEDSDIAVAASTLAVAAMFRPLRSRVQAFIDLRFYRRKYDAAATLGEFATRLREQVDLDSLQRELVSVVGATMQPAHASLWIRSEATR